MTMTMKNTVSFEFTFSGPLLCDSVKASMCQDHIIISRKAAKGITQPILYAGFMLEGPE